MSKEWTKEKQKKVDKLMEELESIRKELTTQQFGVARNIKARAAVRNLDRVINHVETMLIMDE